MTGSDGVTLVGRSFIAREHQPTRTEVRTLAEHKALRGAAEDPPSLILTDEEEIFLELLRAGAGGRSIYTGEKRLREEDGVTRFSFVNNPDGTVRWLFRAGARDAAHLELYNANTLKGRLYRPVVRVLSRVGMGDRLASGGFAAGFSETDLLARWLGEDTCFDTVALFSGTRGLDRKVVFALGRRGRVTHFLKVPLGAESRALLENELSVLQRIGGELGPGLVVPGVARGRGGAVLFENVRPRRPRSGIDVTERHLGFISALYSRFSRTAVLGETAIYRDLVDRVSRLPRLEPGASEGLAQQGRAISELASRLIARLPVDRRIAVSLAHADFTPWNAYEGKGTLHVYDWELAREAPLLSDLFHFVCQTGVLVRRESPERIIQRLRIELEKPSVRALVQRYHVDPDLHLCLYLLEKAAYYLERYTRQKDLHRQTGWLLDFWVAVLERYVGEPKLLAAPAIREGGGPSASDTPGPKGGLAAERAS